MNRRKSPRPDLEAAREAAAVKAVARAALEVSKSLDRLARTVGEQARHARALAMNLDKRAAKAEKHAALAGRGRKPKPQERGRR